MKKFYTIVLIIIAFIISQQVYPQKENSKGRISGEQQIVLSQGFSFISSRIVAENPDMQDILQNNLTNLGFVRNTGGLMFRKIGPIWVNGIGDWVNTEGFIFKMNNADELTIIGDVIDPQTPIELSTGYQIIGYLPDQPLNTGEVFQDVLENLGFVRNTAGLMLRKIGPTWINGIGDMQPGEGYLVKMFADDVLIYPGPSAFTCGDFITDPRDGQTYNSIQIGNQCWMTENLNIGTLISGSEDMSDDSIIEKYCHDNNTVNCDEYGGLYQWNEMMQYSTTQGIQGICPTGWNIPTDNEWTILTDYLGGEGVAGGKMKEAGTTHWSSPNSGATNESGFTALPGGHRHQYGSFFYLTTFCYFWSSSEYSSNGARYRGLSFSYGQVNNGSFHKDYGFSVRCLKDDFTPINRPPEPPASPDPENGEGNQPIEVDLSWTCTDPDGDPLTYDIYFGTEAIPPQVVTGQTETIHDPGVLEISTVYFWKIVAHDDHGNMTEGPVWNFFTISQSCPGIPTVTYEGQVYNTVLIGNQCWLKENLNIGTMIDYVEEPSDNGIIEKYCYDNNAENCEIYGGLYFWSEAMQYIMIPGAQGICPSGWHIPTDDEWKILEGTVDSQYHVGDTIWNNKGHRGYDAGLNLKSVFGWNNNGNGTDGYGFSALPGGCRTYNPGFGGLSERSYFWPSGDGSRPNAWGRSLFYNYNDVYRSDWVTDHGFSVRCLKNDNY